MEAFREKSPYLNGPQIHHASDFKYSRFNSLISNTEAKSGSTTDEFEKSVEKNAVGIALFGLGRAGTIHLCNLIGNPRVKLLYVVDSDEDRCRMLQSHWGALLPDVLHPDNSSAVFSDPRVDAVLVATPTFTHFDIIRTALDAGKMVFSEKPVAESAEEIRRCCQLAAERGLSIFCAFNRRFDPAFRTVQEAVRRGDVGVVHVIKTVARDSPLPSIEYIKISGGIFHDCVVHDIDLICWVLGEWPQRVFAAGRAHIPEVAAIGDRDTVAVVMEFAGGALGTIDISRNAVYGYDQRLEVFGPKGMLSAGNERPVNVHHLTCDGHSAVPFYHSFPSRYAESYKSELEAFLDHVQGKIPLPIPPEDSMRVSKIATACETSLATGAYVTLDYSD